MSKIIQTFLKTKIILVPVIIFLFFGLYKARDFLEGSKIIIESPINGQIVSNSYLEIKGTVKNITFLYLNGRQIFTNSNNNSFKENLLLTKGYNIIEISASDKFNRKTTVRREVVLK